MPTMTRRLTYRACVMLPLLVAALCFCRGAIARPIAPPDQPGPFLVGRETVVFTDPSRDGGRVLKTDVWFPVSPGSLVLGNSVYEIGVDEPFLSPAVIVSQRAYSDMSCAWGTFPMVVYSHGDSTWRYISSYFCEQLASHGFIVVAADHTGDRAIDFVNGTLDPLNKVAQDRPYDISFVITKMLARSADPDDSLFERIDANKIAVAGWSIGGFAALSMATGYGTAAPDPRVKALITMCASTYTLTTQAMAATNVPTLVFSGSADTLQYYSDTIYQSVGTSQSYLIRIRRAWHDSFNDLCSIYRTLSAQGFNQGALNQVFSYPNDVCPPDMVDTDEVHRIVNLYAVSFLKVNLGIDPNYASYLTESYADINLPSKLFYFYGFDTDRNANGIPDAIDIANNTSPDDNHNGIPDEAEALRLFVRPGATGRNCGTSWDDACTDLSRALQIARSHVGDPPIEIWVAQGIYVPEWTGSPNATARTASFRFVPNCSMYGGFAGNETSLDQRDWLAHPTILSGDQNGDDGPDFENTTDNSYNVFTGNAYGAPGLVDGFIIQGGRADGNVSFWGGGAVSAIMGQLPNFAHCTFRGNQGIAGGALITAVGDGSKFIDCLFDHNATLLSTRDGGGGAIAAYSNSYPTFINCTIADNTSATKGGGLMSEFGAWPSLKNCIVWNNWAFQGPQLRVENYTGTEPNSSLAVLRCDVQGGLAAVSIAPGGTLNWDPANLDVDPLFTPGDSSRPYGLQYRSPCADVGLNSYLIWPGNLKDLANKARVQDGNGHGSVTVDLGAYEYTPLPCPGELSGDGRITTKDLTLLLRNYGFEVLPFTNGDFTGDGMVNSYDLSVLLSHFGETCP